MEEWYAVVNTYEEADGTTFLKACQTAQVVLSDDLSSMEIEWFVDTLLLEPVNLLKTVGSMRSDTDGHHGISQALKLLSKLVTKHPDVVSQHFESIVNLCELTYDSKTRPNAMHCLTSVVPHSELVAANYMRYVRLLDNDTTCKAPIAELVGAICEHHSDIVAEDVSTIFRVYLNLLDTGLSDTVKKYLLTGVLGLLKSFGQNLPTAELNVFYGLLVPLAETDKCKEGFLKVLQYHSGLFPEKLAADKKTRDAVWIFLEQRRFASAQNAILSVYEAIYFIQDEEEYQNMLSSEVSLKVFDRNAIVRFTALRVLGCHGNVTIPTITTDAPSLEFKMRQGRLDQDDLETVLWCIESANPDGETLLKAAILYHRSLNKEYKERIAVHGLLDSTTELRKNLVAFLANETCRSMREGDGEYLTLWRSLFDTKSEREAKCEQIFEDYLEYLVDSLQRHLLANDEEPNETMKWTLKASACIIPLAYKLNGGGERCISALRLLTRMAQTDKRPEAVFAAARPLLQRLDGRRLEGCRMEFSIDECQDDDSMREGCLVTLLTPVTNSAEAAKALHALDIVLSETALEPSLLSGALSNLETLIVEWGDKLEEVRLNQMIRQIMMLHRRLDYKGKDGRELRRHILIFLGKYGRNIQPYDNYLNETYNLGNCMVLKIMDLGDESTNKINLQELFRLALQLEDPKAIRPLLDLLRANSSERTLTASEKRAVCESTYALARTQAPLNTHLLDACSDAAVGTLLQYLGLEPRPSVRRALCDVLRRLSLSHKSLEDDQMVLKLDSYARKFIELTKPVGVDVSEVLLDVLKHQNSLAKQMLPSLLLQLAQTRLIYALTAFKTATDLFLDKIELFDEHEIGDLMIRLLQNHNGVQTQDGDTSHEMADLRVLRAFTSSTVYFVKGLCERNAFDLNRISEVLLVEDNVNSRVFFTLSVIRREFDLREEECRKIMRGVEKILFGSGIGTSGLLRLEGVLAFCNEYSEALLELHREDTIKLLSEILTALQPQQIIVQEQNLKTCFTKITASLGTVPQFLETLEKWCQQLPLDGLEENLLKGDCPEKDVVLIHSLRNALNLFGICDPEFASLGVRSQQWLKIILKHDKSGLTTKRLSNLDYFNNLLYLSFKFNENEVKNILIKVSDGFSERFMPALFEYLTKKPFIMIEDQFRRKFQLLNGIVKESLRRRDHECSNVLELVDQMWSTYEAFTDFDSKHSLLLQSAALPTRLGPDSNPMRWLKDSICSEEISPAMKAKFVGVIPAEDAYMDTWRRLAGYLPARPSEVSGDLASLFKALLRALASNGALLEILAPLLAHTDEDYGWYDEAVDACLSSLAAKGGLAAAQDLYRRSAQDLSLKVCRRLLVPMLSRCSSAVCEEFFSEIVGELVCSLQRAPRGTTPHHVYHKAVAAYLKGLVLLRVAFERIPRDHIMSPKSLLYTKMDGVDNKTFHLAKIVAKNCANLAEKKIVQVPEGANKRLEEACLQFHCENYNCLSSAITCWAPAEEKVYKLIFDKNAWVRIVDCNKEYDLPIRTHTQRWQPKEVKEGTSTPSARSKTSLTRTKTRTRTFLDSLSEDPNNFDLDPQVEEQEVYTEESLPQGVLNSHPCASQLTSVVKIATKSPHSAWLKTLAEGLNTTQNVGWLLAQVICNCREDLKPFAGDLRPALLEMILKTSEHEKLLNGIHVDVLDTIVYWQDANLLPAESIANLNAIVERLISSCTWYYDRKAIADTLLGRFDSILALYGNVVTIDWQCLKEFVNVTCKDTARTYFNILKYITLRKVRVPQMFSSLLDALEGENGNEKLVRVRQLGKVGQLGKILGQAAALEGADMERLKSLRRFLERKKSDMQMYIELVQGIQDELPSVCDLAMFRSLVSITLRTAERTRGKLLNILSTHIRNSTEDYSEVLEGVRILEMVAKGDEAAIKFGEEALFAFPEPLRSQLVGECMRLYESGTTAAVGVLLKAFEGLMQPNRGEPSLKRAAVSSPLLGQWAAQMATLGLALADKGAVAERTRVAKALPANSSPRDRFTEAFILCVYLPMLHHSGKCSSANFWALLEIFFMGFRDSKALKQPLRDYSDCATSSMEIGYLSDGENQEEAKSVQDVLNAVLHFTKRSVEATTALWLQLSSLLWRRGAGFEPAALLVPLLNGKRKTRPLLLASRIFVEECCAVDGFKEKIDALVKSSRDSEVRDLVLLLHEDILLRTSGMDYFFLGKSEESEDIEMVDSKEEFSLKDLIASFGSLSNWDQLTVQQRDSIRRSLPPLWTDLTTFHAQFDEWKDDLSIGWSGAGWLSKMACAYRSESKQGVKWLNNLWIERKASFDSAATVEAVELERMVDHAAVTVPHLLCDIEAVDCLAEWSARLMARSVCLNALLSDEDSENRAEQSKLRKLSLLHALRWCKGANERAIPAQVINCIRTIEEDDRKCLGWLNEELIALRRLAFDKGDTEDLSGLLRRAEIESIPYIEGAAIEDFVEINKLQIQLHTDLKSLSKEKLRDILNMTLNRCIQNHNSLGPGNKKALSSMVLMAFTHYDNQWEQGSTSQDYISLHQDMTHTLDLALELNLKLKYSMLVDVLIYRLSQKELNTEVLNAVVDELDSKHTLDDFDLEALKANSALSPRLLQKLQFEESSVEELKNCLQLIADPEHSLRQYCKELYSAVDKEDSVAWTDTFKRMKGKIFENPLAGPDYKVLGRHQNTLYALECFDTMNKETTKQVLVRLIKDLASERQTLRLSQLCPALTRSMEIGGSETERLSRLLMLPASAQFYKLEELVTVFTDSARRPAVVTVRLCDGRRRRWIVKCGESLKRDAAAMRMLEMMASDGIRTHYNVRPLSKESGLIEFLEDHERLRSFISSRYEIKGILDSTYLPENEESNLDPEECLRRFKLNCEKVPAHSLRSVMELRCASVEEFLFKKRRFQDSLGVATFSSWILGLGDRHLDNLMYNHRDGSIVLVDWNPVLRHGRMEVPPARLTRALLAPCSFTVLESQLQRLVSESRVNHRLLQAVLKVSFQWLGQEFEDALENVSDLLSGRALPHQVSLRGLEKSPSGGAKRAMRVVKGAFKHSHEKDSYSATEQVTDLLRHCTDPRILSITRPLWEPWI